MRPLVPLAAFALLFGALSACMGEESSDSDPTAPTAVVLEHGDPQGESVALLFDVGADAGATDDILRILRSQQVRATFALTGVWAEMHRDLLFSISSEGHQIINGTYDGRSWTGASTGTEPLDDGERQLALSRAEVTVYRYTSQSTLPFFRPPHDDVDGSVLRDASGNGYGVAVGWTLSLAESGVEQVIERADEGTIIRISTDAATETELNTLVAGLRERGFGFVTIREMTP